MHCEATDNLSQLCCRLCVKAGLKLDLNWLGKLTTASQEM